MILEVSATRQDGTVVFKEEKEYRNIGLSRKGESVAAAWLISSYSEEKSTAFKPLEVKKEIFNFQADKEQGSEIRIDVKIYSFHGVPTEFGQPAGKDLVLQKSGKVKL